MIKDFCKKDISARCALLDCLRGLLVISMVLYHAMWDLTYLFGVNAPWFYRIQGRVWQQTTCCMFILLSGFCSAIGKQSFRRGFMVFGAGAVVSVVTVLFMPKDVILFGVLTFIGSAMLITAAMKPLLMKTSPYAGMLVGILLFILFREVNTGKISFLSYELMMVPQELYRNYLTAYFGFPQDGFFSTDYFSLLPWIFLFLTGFFLFRICGKQILAVKWKGVSFLNQIGCHALVIYILHQPVIYGILSVWKM